jgi:hypothetical protein
VFPIFKFISGVKRVSAERCAPVKRSLKKDARRQTANRFRAIDSPLQAAFAGSLCHQLSTRFPDSRNCDE